MSKIHHAALSIPASQYPTLLAWYEAALAPISYAKTADFHVAAGFGPQGGYADFWLGQNTSATPSDQIPMHIAFVGKNHAEVDAFYEAAIKAGGVCNGKPGVREHWYHKHYYAAFVKDLMGNNVEVVCNTDE